MANPFFNSELYLARNPDLVIAGLQTRDQLWSHYVSNGAAESLTVANRAPNSWFDVAFYLSVNSDLPAAGITAATALDHYYTHGVNEGRVFNASSDLAPSNFGAAGYAAANPDLRAAFGITDTAELSPAQVSSLMTHYLAFGYAEDREGVNANFGKHVISSNKINLDDAFKAGNIAYGTIADDYFVSGEEALVGRTINGLGGNDTVEFNKANFGVKLQNIEQVVVKASTEFSSNKLLGIQIEQGKLKANFDAAVVAGANDSLVVNSNAVNTNVTVNGIENLGLNLGSTVKNAVISADQARGDSLTVSLVGGAETGVNVTLDSVASTGISSLVVHGGSLAGALSLTLKPELNNLEHITVVGSQAEVNQDFAAVATAFKGLAAKGHSLSITGGAGADTFGASTAIDSFVGGAGADTFTFAAGNSLTQIANGKIAALDTIADFGAGDTLTGVAVKVATATGSAPSHATLEQLVTKQVGTLTDGDVFGYGSDTYVLVKADADLANVELIKLAGVDVSSVSVTAGELTIA